MAEATALAFNVSVPSDVQGRSRLEKLMHKWLDDEAGRRLKYVLWGPGSLGKSTLALKLAEVGVQAMGFEQGAGRHAGGAGTSMPPWMSHGLIFFFETLRFYIFNGKN
jgi:hypothetical protein